MLGAGTFWFLESLINHIGLLMGEDCEPGVKIFFIFKTGLFIRVSQIFREAG